jgi:leucyl aminopeptidase
MKDSFVDLPIPISIRLASPGQPAAPLLIQLKPAPVKPTLGEPSRQNGEVILSTTTEERMTATVSLGKAEKLTPDAYRQAGGGLAHWLAKSGATTADLDLDPVLASSVVSASALLEGIYLGAFQFNRHKQVEEEVQACEIVLRSKQPGLEGILERVTAVTSAVNLARDWAHEPPNVINPVSLAERVAALAENDGLKVTVMDEHALAELGAGAILSVGKGSATPPRLIIVEYGGSGAEPGAKPVVLIGKALTFDTGGYSMKSVEGIQGMKYDKCGGVTVAALLHLACQLRVKSPVIGIIGAAENMVSGEAYRPDDIIRTLSGKTVEIISTDAEGRLVLADCLTYAQNTYQPRSMIDLATLTGGVITALGHVRGGLMSNNDDLAAALFSIGESVHERLWRLPLDEDFEKLIKGDDANIKNSGGREGHAILGGTFLQQFVNDSVPWAHLDIAGVAETSKDLAYSPKGATGFGVRLLIEYLESL